jgi:hypothetical protein
LEEALDLSSDRLLNEWQEAFLNACYYHEHYSRLFLMEPSYLSSICIWQVTKPNQLDPAIIVKNRHKIKLHVDVFTQIHRTSTENQTPQQMTLRYFYDWRIC